MVFNTFLFKDYSKYRIFHVTMKGLYSSHWEEFGDSDIWGLEAGAARLVKETPLNPALPCMPMVPYAIKGRGDYVSVSNQKVFTL